MGSTMIPQRSVPVRPVANDPKSVLTSAVKLVALMGTTCLVVGLIAAGALVGLLLQFGAAPH
jgi:hypothetical protein